MSSRRTVWLILPGAAVMFGFLQFGVDMLDDAMDRTTSFFVATGAMLGFAFTYERLVFRRSFGESLRALGWVRANARAVSVSVIVTAAMLLFFPIAARVTGTPIRLHPDSPWLVLGAIALNGIGEETLFRGFVFGHLRRAGLSFIRAGLVSLAIFTGVHLFLFVENSVAIALSGTAVALMTSFPLAYLFERAGYSIWPTVIFHVGTHAIRFVSIPEPKAMPIMLAWLVLQMVMPLSIFAFRGNLLRPVTSDARGEA